MKKSIVVVSALLLLAFSACGNPATELGDTAEENMAYQTLAGSCWFWPSLQLYFISPDRVMLYSVGGYYPQHNYPFKYSYPAQGYAYSYTWDAESKKGYIRNLGEYSGGDLGAFVIGADNQSLDFADYKSYEHGANFLTVRPPPAGGHAFDSPLPANPDAADMRGTVWAGTLPGADFGGVEPGRHPVFIYFDSASHAFITRTYDVDTDAEKLREFKYDCVKGSGTISDGVGDFTLSSPGTLRVLEFPVAYDPGGDPPTRGAVEFHRIGF